MSVVRCPRVDDRADWLGREFRPGAAGDLDLRSPTAPDDLGIFASDLSGSELADTGSEPVLVAPDDVLRSLGRHELVMVPFSKRSGATWT